MGREGKERGWREREKEGGKGKEEGRKNRGQREGGKEERSDKRVGGWGKIKGKQPHFKCVTKIHTKPSGAQYCRISDAGLLANEFSTIKFNKDCNFESVDLVICQVLNKYAVGCV